MFTINAVPATVEVYNNAEAHKEVRAMMARGERMAMFFALDKYGCETVRIESRTTQRFTYQLMAFVNANVGNFQTRPAFLDRPGRLTTTATFKHGSIQFFTERDTEIENFLQEHKLIG